MPRKKKDNEVPRLGKDGRLFFAALSVAALKAAETGSLDPILEFAMETQAPGVWEILAEASASNFN